MLNFDHSHVRLRMKQRKVDEQQVQRCVDRGTVTTVNNRSVYQLDDLKVVVNKRTLKVITVLTTDVTLLPWPRLIRRDHLRRISDELGVHAWYDHDAQHYELYGAPERVQNACNYIQHVDSV